MVNWNLSGAEPWRVRCGLGGTVPTEIDLARHAGASACHRCIGGARRFLFPPPRSRGNCRCGGSADTPHKLRTLLAYPRHLPCQTPRCSPNKVRLTVHRTGCAAFGHPAGRLGLAPRPKDRREVPWWQTRSAAPPWAQPLTSSRCPCRAQTGWRAGSGALASLSSRRRPGSGRSVQKPSTERNRGGAVRAAACHGH
jgi:hypothetical protein